MREDGSQAVVWQTAINPVVALELLATGVWSGSGVARAGGVRRRAVPRPADRVRVAVGDARGRLGRASCGAHPSGGSQSGAASSKPSKSNAGRDDAPDQRPRPERPRGLPGALGHDRLDDGPGGAADLAAQPVHGDRRVALGPGPQLEVVAGRPLPDLVGIEPMPVRALAGRQQEQDRAARPAARRRPPPPATSRRTSHPRDAPASRVARRPAAPRSRVAPKPVTSRA